MSTCSLHHLWGNVGYRHSAYLPFLNVLGMCHVGHNPDSWEGWHWGGMHMRGFSHQLGKPEQYNLLGDALKHAEMIVFWSSVGNDFSLSLYSVGRRWPGMRWVSIERKERGQYPMVQVSGLPVFCIHCDDDPCPKNSPPGTIYKREDGLVIIDPRKAKGRPEIVDTCPRGAIYWNEGAKVAQKCTGCVRLPEAGWTETRWSQVCATEATKLVLADAPRWPPWPLRKVWKPSGPS